MSSYHIRDRRAALWATVLLALAFALPTVPAGAQSTSERLDRAQERAGRLRSDAERVASAYARTEEDIGETTQEIAETKATIMRAEGEMDALRQRLKDRVRAAYRTRGIGFFQFLLEAGSFREFTLRLMTFQRQALADEDLILELRKKRHELDLRQADLDRQQQTLESRKTAYEQESHRLTVTLEQADRVIEELRDDLSREQIARAFTIRSASPSAHSRPTRGRAIGLGACPVDPPRVVTSSFGAARGGGSRRHDGNDLMAPMGTAVRAVKSGTVRGTSSGGAGGIAFYLWDGATEYYYAHLSRLSVGDGQSVSAGQLVGANGNSGNASGGPPHVHFEIHPGGGGAIDPYPSLSAVC